MATEEMNTSMPLLLAKNDAIAWEYVYDKYSPIMYGAILQMTSNKKLAEEILIIAFKTFKKRSSFPVTSPLLLICILRHTIDVACKHLQAKGIKPKSYKAIDNCTPTLHHTLFSSATNLHTSSVRVASNCNFRNDLKREIASLRNL